MATELTTSGIPNEQIMAGYDAWQAEQDAKVARTADAHRVSSEINRYGEVRTTKGIEAAARLVGYLTESLGLTI